MWKAQQQLYPINLTTFLKYSEIFKETQTAAHCKTVCNSTWQYTPLPRGDPGYVQTRVLHGGSGAGPLAGFKVCLQIPGVLQPPKQPYWIHHCPSLTQLGRYIVESFMNQWHSLQQMKYSIRAISGITLVICKEKHSMYHGP